MKNIVAILCIVVGLSSCYDHNAADLYPTTCDTTVVTYSATIKPIVAQHCAVPGCHTGSTPANGLAYDQYGDLKVVAQNGQLVQAIKHEGSITPMPKNLPMLDQCSINKIVRWVNQGYLNN